MPLVTISLLEGKSPAYIRAVSDGVHKGLVQAFGAPRDDKFHLVRQLQQGELIYDPDYLGINRTDDLVVVHIVAGNWRDTAKKKTLFAAITDNLAASPGLRRGDVLIVLSPNGRDDWSFGNGVASYVSDDPA